MSYDLMVFDAQVAPRNIKAFQHWYAEQTQWAEDHPYDDPKVCQNPALAAFMQDITQDFPAMNGVLASPEIIQLLLDTEQDAQLTNYSIGKYMVYCCFAWSQAKAAHTQVMQLAARHALGFYNPSSAPNEVFIPQGGQLFGISH